ncbi:MAG: hypothetical protein BMS9Abin01_2533 [Gammaproteobacteria bacterium]|nr:MAG: hypothetical protein BMS9Abin01_2533 [Gammaproteobacteria bacterium]
MRTGLKTLITASALVAGIAAAPLLYAQSAEDTPGTQAAPMGHDKTKGHGGMMGQGDKTGQGNMMGMMMSDQMMDQMIEAHDKMMKAMMEAHDAAPSDKK